jgi:hypothetical protein
MLRAIEAAIEALEAGDVDAARARLRALAAAIRAQVTSGSDMAFGVT